MFVLVLALFLVLAQVLFLVYVFDLLQILFLALVLAVHISTPIVDVSGAMSSEKAPSFQNEVHSN